MEKGNSPALSLATLLTMEPAGLVITHLYSFSYSVKMSINIEKKYLLSQLIKKSFVLVAFYDTLPVGECLTQALKQEMVER